jgi:hypothetical protein
MKEESIISIPNSILCKLFDHTGSESGSNRGFFLFYINSDGTPVVTSKTENACVSLAIRKVMEMFLEESNLLENQ